MKHDKFTITIKFVCCDGQKAKVLEELKELRLLILGNELQNKGGHFDHAHGTKFHVSHEETTE